MGALKAYAPRDNKNVEAKNKLINNVKNFYKGREKIIEGFKLKMEYFQFIMMSVRRLEKKVKKMKKMKKIKRNKSQ